MFRLGEHSEGLQGFRKQIDTHSFFDADERCLIGRVRRRKGGRGVRRAGDSVQILDEVQVVDHSRLARIGVFVPQKRHLHFIELRADERAIELTIGDFAHLVSVVTFHGGENIDATLFAVRSDAREHVVQSGTFILRADVTRRTPRVQIRRRSVGQAFRVCRDGRFRIF